MAITIDDHELPFDTHNEYDVHMGTDTIHTLLTHCPQKVNEWVTKIESLSASNSSSSSSNLLVGLDIEWRPNRARNQDNPAATLQLCVGHHCLVFQLLYCPQDRFPQRLVDFLSKTEYTFVGVGIEHDIEKLVEDWGLSIGGKVVNLGKLACEKRGDGNLKKAGMKELARVVLGKEIEKPKWVTMSRWDYRWLKPEQVKYACIDAFVSFEIGRILDAYD